MKTTQIYTTKKTSPARAFRLGLEGLFHKFVLAAFLIACFFIFTTPALADVSHGTSSESHTGTTGATSTDSFSWSHPETGSPEGVLVFVTTIANADYISSVTYGGVAMTQVSEAADTATEPARVTAFYLGSGIPTSTQTIVVNRTNNATIMYASAATVQADGDTGTIGYKQIVNNTDGYYAPNIQDGFMSTSSNSLRYVGAYYGANNVLPVSSASTTLLNNIDFGSYTSNMAVETSGGLGFRKVGFTNVTADDRAAIHLAIRETNFSFSGTLYTDTGITDAGSGKTIKMAIGTSTPSVYSTTTTTGGNWSFSEINLDNATSGTPIIFWLDGDANDATTLVSGYAANIPLYYGHNVIYTASTSMTLNLQNFSVYDSSDDVDILYTVTGTTSTSTGNLFIKQGTFVPTEIFNITGSYTNNDTFSKIGSWVGGSPSEPNAWVSVTYGNGLFVAVSTDGTNRVMTSSNGITWSARSAAAANAWYDVTYGNGLFVAVSTDGTHRVMTSPDGITWATSSAAINNSWQSVTYGNGLFVAVSATTTSTSTAVMTSTDGISWMSSSASGSNGWRAVTYGNGLFVAVGDSGAVMTSHDGITWTARNASESNNWQEITYGNGLFVALATSANNQVMTSPDGITWTSRPVYVDRTVGEFLYGLGYGDGLFVVGGATSFFGKPSKIFTSVDGINWKILSADEITTEGNYNSIRDIAYGNNRFVVVGDGNINRVMTSIIATTTINGTSNQTLAGAMTGTSALGSVNFSGAGTKTFTGIASTTNFTIATSSGAVTAPASLAIAGNYTNSGTLNTTASSTTVFLDGTLPQTLSGTSTFYNLNIQNQTGTTSFNNALTVSNNLTATKVGSILALPANATSTIATTTITGVATNTVKLRSTTYGSQARLAVTNSYNITYADVLDNNACGSVGGGIDVIGDNVTDSGNNTCWTFALGGGGGGGEATTTPPTFIQEVETVWNTTTSPKTTASFDVLAGDVLVAYSTNGEASGDDSFGISGGSLTWTRQVSIITSSNSELAIWTAIVDTNKSMTVSFTSSAAVAFGGSVSTFRGSDGIGATSSTNVSGGAPTLNLTTTGVRSAIFVANGDWNAVDGSSRTWRTNAGTLTERSYYLDTGNYTEYGGYHADVTATGTYAVGLSAPGAQKYSLGAIEILGHTSTSSASSTGNFIVSGILYEQNRTTAYATSTTIKLAVATSTVSTYSTTSVATTGAFSFDLSLGTIATGTTATLFTDGSAVIKAVTVTETAGSGTTTISSLPLYKDHVVIRNESTGTTTRASDLSRYDSTNDSDIQFTASSTLNTFTALGTTTLYVASGTTFHLNYATTTAHNFELATTSSIVLASSTIVLSGNYANYGTFSAGTSTVYASGTAASSTYTGISFDTAASGNANLEGVTFYNGYFYAIDPDDDEVYQYNASGTYTGTSFDTAASGNTSPLGITTYNGYFYITDYDGSEVYQYTTSGTLVSSFDTAASGNAYPEGITVYNGFFYIVDLTDAEVYKYNLNGTYTGTSFDTAASGNANPTGLIAYNNFFYVVDITDSEVYQYSASGTYTGTSFDTLASGNGNPEDITIYNGYFYIGDSTDAEVYRYTAGQGLAGNMTGVSSFNNLIFAGNAGKDFAANASTTGNFTIASTSGEVRAPLQLTVGGNYTNSTSTGFNANSGTVIASGIASTPTYTNFSFDIAASGNGAPVGIATYNDHFYVPNIGDGEIYQYNLDGTYTGFSFDTEANGNTFPEGITAYNGYFYVTDYSDAEVYKYTLDGTYTGTSFDTGASGNGSPVGITAYNNYFYVVDDINAEVYKYNPDGTYTGTSFDTTAVGNSAPQGITAYNGYFYVTDFSDAEIYQYTTSGTYVANFNKVSGNDESYGITVHNGYFYVTDYSDAEVYQYTAGQGLSGNMTGTSAFSNLTFAGSAGKDFAANASTTGSFTIASTSGEVRAPLQLSIAGNYTNSTSTGFNANSGTTTFNGTSAQTISGVATGSSAFHNLTLQNQTATTSFSSALTVSNNFTATKPGSIIALAAGATSTIANATITGSSTNLVKLLSTASGTQARLVVTNSYDITYANIKDNNACGSVGGGINAGITSTSSGNLTCWTFTAGGGASDFTVTGILYEQNRTTAYATSTTVKIAVATSTVSTYSTTTVATTGAFSFNISVGTLATGTPVTIFTDGSAVIKAVTVTKTSGTSTLTNLPLYKDHVIVRNEATGTTTKASDLIRYDSTNDSDIQFTASSTLSTLTTIGTTTLYVASGTTFHMNYPTSAYSFETATTSSTVLASSTLTFTANYANNGTFYAGTSTVNASGTAPTPVYTNFSFDTSGNGSDAPEGIAYYNNFFYVIDDADAVVYQYTTSGTYTGTSFDTAASGNASPNGITAYNGYFYITNYGDAQVYQYTTSGTYTGFSFDTEASGNGSPYGIVVYNNFFYITDWFDDEVYKYNLDGTYTGTSFDTAASGNTDPGGIFTYNGSFYVTDWVDAEVYQYSASGNYVTSFDTALSGNGNPEAVIAYNGYFYITDYVDAEVYRYTAGQGLSGNMTGTSAFSNLTFAGSAGKDFAANASTTGNFTIASNSGEVRAPLQLTVGGNYTNSTSTGFNANSGTVIASSIAPNPTYTNFSFDTAASGNANPAGIIFHDGYFYIGDYTDDEVYKYNVDGTYTGTSFDTAASGNANPSGITFYNNFFYVVDYTNAEVYKYNLDGTYTGTSFDTAASGNGNSEGITAYNGYFYLTDSTDAEVYKYNLDGTYAGATFDTSVSGNGYPVGIIVYNGYLYVTDWTDAEVYKYNLLDGTYTGTSFDTAANGSTDPDGITIYNGFFYVGDDNGAQIYQYTAGQGLSGTMTGTSAFNNLTFAGSAGKDFAANASTTGSFTIASTSGEVRAPLQLTVGGNYTNSTSTGFNANSGTTTFNGTSAQTISGVATGTSAFGSVVFSGAGQKTFASSSASTTNFIVQSTSGRVITPATLSVAGNYTNNSTTTMTGANWTQTIASAPYSWESVTYGNGLFVAVNSNGGIGNSVMTSPDGITWTARDVAEANQWRAVTYGNGLFVAVADTGTNRVMRSTDGITWATSSAAQANIWRSVIYGNGTFVAVSNDGTNRVMRSTDGITWATSSAAQANIWTSVTYGNGLFVAVSQSGTNQVMRSTDGITWATSSAAEANQWQSVIYGNGLFVAVADSGTNRVMTSPDGINWTPRSSPSELWWEVTYGNGLFVAISDDGTLLENQIMTSPDGINWTAYDATSISAWESVAYGNGRFVVVSWADSNKVMVSLDNTTFFSGSATQTISGTLTGASQLRDVRFSGAGTKTFSSNASTTNFTIATSTATVTAPTILSVSGNFTNRSTFAANSGTVILTGLDQTLSGTTTFNHLSKAATNHATTTFEAGTLYTVSGNLTFLGVNASTTHLLRSSASGTQWKIDPQGSRTLSYLNVKDSNNINVTTVSCSTGCIDGTNNTNWSFSNGGSVSMTSVDNYQFYVGQATTTLDTISLVVSDATAANDIRLSIATTTSNFRFNTGTTNLTFGGTASAKVAGTVTYADAGATMVINVTNDFAAEDTLTIGGVAVGSFGTVGTTTSSFTLHTDGNIAGAPAATDSKTIRITGSLLAANHTAGQVDNEFNFQDKNDEPVFAFNLTAVSENATMTDMVITLAGIQGIDSTKLSDFKLYRDNNSDLLLDGGDTLLDASGIMTINGQHGATSWPPPPETTLLHPI
jgi:hypothetical protein